MKIPDIKLKKPQLKKPSLKRNKASSAKPDVKAPRFASDLYEDLRDRRLLPLVALLVVAIVVAPILLAKDDPEEPASAAASGLSLATPSSQASFSVAPAPPQLRDYRRRLGYRDPRDPFEAPPKPPKTDAESEGSGEGEAKEGSSTPTESPVVEGGESDGGTNTKTDVVIQNKVIGYEIRIKAGYFDSNKPKKQVAAPTKLPNAKNPLLVFTGLTKDNKRALFLMSSKVTAYYGKAHCALDKQACQLVELTPGKSATFAYGYGESRYKLTLNKIVPVIATRTSAASVTTKTPPPSKRVAVAGN